MITIKKEIHTSGKSLMKNRNCEVTIKPSDTGRIRIFSKGADILLMHVSTICILQIIV